MTLCVCERVSRAIKQKHSDLQGFSATPAALQKASWQPRSSAVEGSITLFLFALKGPDSRQNNSSVLLVMSSSSFFYPGNKQSSCAKLAHVGLRTHTNFVACEKWRKCCKRRCNNHSRRLRRPSSYQDCVVYFWNPKWGLEADGFSKQHVIVLTVTWAVLIKEHIWNMSLALNSVRSSNGAHLRLVSRLPLGKWSTKRLSVSRVGG